MKDKQLSETLKKILEGQKFRRTDHSSSLVYYVHTEPFGPAVFQKTSSEPLFIAWVDSNSRGNTLVINASLLGVEVKANLDVSTDLTLIEG